MVFEFNIADLIELLGVAGTIIWVFAKQGVKIDLLNKNLEVLTRSINKLEDNHESQQERVNEHTTRIALLEQKDK